MNFSNLEKALSIAMHAHEGQRDKSGFPYIFHPIRVMLNLDDVDAQVVALLHDTLEDSDVSIEDLKKAGFKSTIIKAILLLTKKENEDYFDYIQRIKKNPLARQVKLADIKDNLNAGRLIAVSETDCERIRRYLKAKEILLSR